MLVICELSRRVVVSNGSRAEVEETKQAIKDFLTSELHLELSEEKTLITHVNDGFTSHRLADLETLCRSCHNIEPHKQSQQTSLQHSSTYAWAVAVGAGAVWVTTSLDSVLARIGPGTNQVVATGTVGLGQSG